MDPLGQSPIDVLKKSAETVVNGFCKAMCYLDSLSNKTKFIIGGTGAAAGAALLAMASPAGAIAVVGGVALSMLAGTLIGGVTEIVIGGMVRKENSAGEILTNFANGAADGAMWAGIASFVTGMVSVAKNSANTAKNAWKAENAAQNVGEGGKNTTGTVWDNITKTADNMPATEIPATFKIDLDPRIKYVNPETATNSLWTNSNATKHMGEYVSRFGEESWSIGTRSQAMLESYNASINNAMSELILKTPGRYFGIYGNWELGINTQTGVVYHARMIY